LPYADDRAVRRAAAAGEGAAGGSRAADGEGPGGRAEREGHGRLHAEERRADRGLRGPRETRGEGEGQEVRAGPARGQGREGHSTEGRHRGARRRTPGGLPRWRDGGGLR